MAKIAFINGYVFNTENETFEKKNVVTENGYILSIGSNIPSDSEIVDLDGKYLVPGLVDVHTHGIGGYDFNDATKEQVEKMRMCYAKAGTTSVMATFASQTPDNLVKYVCETNKNRNKDDGYANIIGIHIEGRYLNPAKKGAHSEKLLEKPRLDELDRLTEVMMPSPMHFSLAPELEGAEAFIKQIKKLGGTVGIAHTNATYEESMDAISWGATSFTHTFNAMSAFSMAVQSVPMIFTPRSVNGWARLMAVWPPKLAITPSGCSSRIMFITSSAVRGSKYSLSEQV